MSSEKRNDYLLVIGLMTGNSLDGVDGVLSKFGIDGSICDITSASLKNPDSLTSALRSLRTAAEKAEGNIEILEKSFTETDKIHDLYLTSIRECIKEILKKGNLKSEDIDLIGLHGQTCTHLSRKYTVQLGDGQSLSDKIGIPVVYDFRSDDIMSGGEGAPLAPIHHEHLARSAKKFLPLAFCNAGNTGNVSLISVDSKNGKEITLGWDAGPFNHYPDFLMRNEKGLACDIDGEVAAKGKVNLKLLEALYLGSVILDNGDNYFELKAPKSSDPAWYKYIPELNDKSIPFEDRLRTAEYFAVYCLIHSLSLIPDTVTFPLNLALCGGGWKNPVVKKHLDDLIKGVTKDSPVLPRHEKTFSDFAQKKVRAEDSSSYGFDSTAMEARIFADAAVSRIKGDPFSRPEITGVTKPVVLGLLKFPGKSKENVSAALKAWMEKFETKILSKDTAPPSKWSRATAGWA